MVLNFTLATTLYSILICSEILDTYINFTTILKSVIIINNALFIYILFVNFTEVKKHY